MGPLTPFVCVTCGTQFPPSTSPPDSCPICLDERQYVGHGGQRWTTLEELAREHRNRIEEVEPGLLGIGTEPSFAIAQRALLVEGLLWDCITLLDDDTAHRVAARGGIHTIAISHPHYYSAMVEWAERFDARILLHESDREWVMRPSERIELWCGERRTVADGLELVRLGGHFDGGTVCVWRAGAEGRGAMLSGDIVQVVYPLETFVFLGRRFWTEELPVATLLRPLLASSPNGDLTHLIEITDDPAEAVEMILTFAAPAEAKEEQRLTP